MYDIMASAPVHRPKVAQVQQMVASLTDVCWDKCVSSPGSYLSSKENSCLENCAKRFVEVTQFILQVSLGRPQPPPSLAWLG